MRKTKIICTIGPACESYEMLKKLAKAGMDCARINFSHGTHEEQQAKIDNIKRVRDELRVALPILLDTKGPEIRLGNFASGYANVKAGEQFIFNTTEIVPGDEKEVSVICKELYEDISRGDTILVDDGIVGFDVLELKDGKIITRVINSGRISNKKSVNIPNVSISLPYMSQQDKDDIIFGIKNQVDYIAASFARDEDDIRELKAFVEENGGTDIKIFAKIENSEGIVNLNAIMKLVDGIMVARGDLGVEIPFRELPAIQKDIIKKCYRAGKHVITATQMLDSMTNNPRPTRAEVSDVANAIYDGTTAIMLSGETAVGNYPVRSLKTMAEIAETTEKAINYKKRFENNHLDLGRAVMSAVANAAVISANQLNATAILAVTRKGVTAKSIANYRPNSLIIAITNDIKNFHQLRLAWNVMPYYIGDLDDAIEDAFDKVLEVLYGEGYISKTDLVVLAGGVKKSNLQTGLLKIHKM